MLATQNSQRIDGCPLEYARKCLAQHDVTPDRHVNLAERDVPKAYHTDYDDEQASEVYGTRRRGIEAAR